MKRRRTRKHSHLLEVTAIAGGVMILVIVALGLRMSGPDFSAAVVQSDLIAYTNVERARNELGLLKENPVLNAAAQAKANDMAAQGYFSHTGPDGQAPWRWFVAAGYDYRFAGENLAVRFSDSREVVNAWMASPTHKANITKAQYQEIGIGVADGTYQGMPVTFVVQFFGTPQHSIEPQARPTAVAKDPTAQPVAAKTVSIVAGAETSAAEVSVAAKSLSLFGRIADFFAGALRSLTASVVESDGVIIGEGASTER